jgi:hypothetical protein
MNPDNFTYTVGIHEAGHARVAAHFRVPALPEILDQGRSTTMQMTFPDTAGICCYDEGRIPALQFAAICWGGQLAQCLYGTPPVWAPPFRPTSFLLRDWWAAMLVQLKRFSPNDREGIMASYRTSWRACKTAYRIIRKDKRHVIRLAQALAAGRNATPPPPPPVPMPDQFPATFADFLRLVVSTDGTTDPEAKLRAFIHDQGQNLLSQPRFGLGPDQLQQAVATWTEGGLEKLKAGFTSLDSWQSKARAFREWSKTKKSPTHPHE